MQARRTAPGCAALLLLALVAPARAEQGAFFPAEDQRLGEQEALLAERVRARVQAETGIAAAGVRVRLPRATSSALDCPLPPPQLSVAVLERDRAHALSEATVAQIARASGLPSPLALQVVRMTAPSPTAFPSPSAAPARPKTLLRDLLLGTSLLANVLLACVLLWRLSRRR